MKRRSVATALNFIVPGAGLWYLNRVRSAIVNLLVAVAVPAVIGTIWQSEHVLYVFLAIAAGSAGYAHAAGTRDLVNKDT